jgi:hypothetical protein
VHEANPPAKPWRAGASYYIDTSPVALIDLPGNRFRTSAVIISKKLF